MGFDFADSEQEATGETSEAEEAEPEPEPEPEPEDESEDELSTRPEDFRINDKGTLTTVEGDTFSFVVENYDFSRRFVRWTNEYGEDGTGLLVPDQGPPDTEDGPWFKNQNREVGSQKVRIAELEEDEL